MRLLPSLAIALGLTSMALTGFAVAAFATYGHFGDVGSIVVGFALGLVGGVAGYRRPRHPIGWLLLFIASTQSLTEFAGAYARYALVVHRGVWPGGAFAAWLNTWMWVPGLGVLATVLLLLFPTGRLPSRRWTVVAVTAVIDVVVAAGAIAAGTWAERGVRLSGSGGPLPSSLEKWLLVVAATVFGICMVASISSLFVRYRRSSSEERHQLKWVAYATVLLAIAIVIDFGVLPIPFAVQTTLVAVGVLPFPVSLGVAILKFRLYDIDLIISRTLVYGVLAALITGVYVAIAVGIGTVVGGGGKPNLGLSIRGNGLTNMEDRLDALGGSLRIMSSPGHGTILRAEVPVVSGVPVG
ncbi:MAG: hypothetical protein NVSMB29_00560 [Candidatus Dormibacteria bacterium]